MPGAARTQKDTAGGTITGTLAPSVFVNGVPVSVIGDPVAPHGPPPHLSPVMAQGSETVFAHGIPVCRKGDKASCGHPATGSSNVFIGG